MTVADDYTPTTAQVLQCWTQASRDAKMHGGSIAAHYKRRIAEARDQEREEEVDRG